MGVLFLRMMQTYEIYSFVNVEMPANIHMLFSYFDTNLLNFIPDPLSYDESGVGCLLHPKLIENDKECMIMNNGGASFVIQILVYGAVKALVYWLYRNSMDITDSWVHLGSRYMDGKMDRGFMVEAASGMQLDLLLAVCVNLRNFFIYPFILFVNSTASLAIMVLFLVLAYNLGIKSYLLEDWFRGARGGESGGNGAPGSPRRPSLERRAEFSKKNLGQKSGSQSSREGEGDGSALKRVKKDKLGVEGMPKHLSNWLFIREPLRDDISGIGAYYLFLIFLKDFVLVGSIIGFLTIPILQVLLPFVYHLVLVSILVVSCPFKSKASAIFYLFGLATELLTLSIFGALVVLDGQTEKFKFEYIGKSMVVLMLVIFVGYMITSVVDTMLMLLEFFRVLCRLMRWKRKAKERGKGEGRVEVSGEIGRSGEQTPQKLRKGMVSRQKRKRQHQFKPHSKNRSVSDNSQMLSLNPTRETSEASIKIFGSKNPINSHTNNIEGNPEAGRQNKVHKTAKRQELIKNQKSKKTKKQNMSNIHFKRNYRGKQAIKNLARRRLDREIETSEQVSDIGNFAPFNSGCTNQRSKRPKNPLLAHFQKNQGNKKKRAKSGVVGNYSNDREEHGKRRLHRSRFS